MLNEYMKSLNGEIFQAQRDDNRGMLPGLYVSLGDVHFNQMEKGENAEEKREAARRGIDTETLVDRLEAEAGRVSEAEVRAYYESRQEALATYRPERIRGYLEFQRRAKARATLLRRLHVESPPRFLLERPATELTPEQKRRIRSIPYIE